MEQISDAVETWLRALLQDFMCEIANHDIGSAHVKYASGIDARMAMLRLAYLRGREDATLPSTAITERLAELIEQSQEKRA